jgi:FkbM family methyltransferase
MPGRLSAVRFVQGAAAEQAWPDSSMLSRWLELSRRARWWLIYLGPQRDVTVDTENGLLTVRSRDWLIGKYLYVRRAHEVNEMRRAVRLLRQEGYLGEPGQGTVIDVGSNIGMACIGFLKSGEFRRAVAFEPTPDSFRLLVHNIAQNGFADRIQAFPMALSSRDGEMALELSEDNSGDNRLRAAGAPGAFREERRRTMKVPVDTLDGFMTGRVGLTGAEIAMIWLDVQGHEGQFFAGARRTLGRRIPVVSEFWPYAITRSGMSRARFHEIVSELFTHFYPLSGDRCRKTAVSQLDELFEVYSGPRQMCLLALVHDKA